MTPTSPQRPRLGLVVQGGVMRTVYAVGALAEMERLGLRDLITAYAGSSGGALAMACFATGNAERAQDQFVESLANDRFVSKRRIRPIVDMDYMVREVIDDRIVGGLDRQLSDLPPAFVAVTQRETGEPAAVRLDGSARKDAAADILVATTAIPILYGRSIPLTIGECVDGGIADPIPLARLLVNCDVDAVLVILTRPVGFGRGRSSFERFAIHADRSIRPRLRRALLAPNPLYSMTVDALRRGAWGRTPVHVIAPSDPDKLVERTTVDHEQLVQSARMGAADLRNVIDTLQIARPIH